MTNTRPSWADLITNTSPLDPTTRQMSGGGTGTLGIDLAVIKDVSTTSE